ncbi:hypothetical protein FA13DRAFT_1794799 [Coprinellus micaceus]|uniref:lytic cellulose monooxygenase (C4-dehydrogenating) n=1 Tax=Coprinellus micaceus TaxID=71717 RepID=A0A4Y7T096_COPMI|nr:hypothetical protein FA13DRAFT_1794799 [Coprinellus micaceus]
MPNFGALSLLAATALLFLQRGSAHYIFRNVILHTPFLNTSDATRIPKFSYPVYDLDSNDIRCNVPNLNAQAKLTLPIEAGSAMYLGKVPEGETSATWDGSGKQWFKVGSNAIGPEPFQALPVVPVLTLFQIKHWGGSGDRNPKAIDKMWTFETYYENTLNFSIPAEVPSGEYLLRVEHIGIHSSSPEFFVSCAQIKVVNGGNDPSLHYYVWEPVPGFVYKVPGPDVWPAGGA